MESQNFFEGQFDVVNISSRQYIRYEDSLNCSELSIKLKSESFNMDKLDADLKEFTVLTLNAVCTNNDGKFAKYGAGNIGGIYLCREYDEENGMFLDGQKYIKMIVRCDEIAIRCISDLSAPNDIRVTGEYMRTNRDMAFAETEWMIPIGRVTEINFSKNLKKNI